MRLVPQSVLAKRIAAARATKSAPCARKEAERRKDSLGKTKKEMLEAKFLLNEIEWKKDAAIDASRRISDGMKQLGL